MTTSQNDGRRLHRLMAALAESVIDASDEDIVEEARAVHSDPAATAKRIRGVLDGAILKAKKARRQQARDEHAATVAAYRVRSTALPEDPATRRLLLQRVIAQKPEMRQAVVTLQHREFDAFTDEDVESALRQLAALGILSDEGSGET